MSAFYYFYVRMVLYLRLSEGAGSTSFDYMTRHIVRDFGVQKIHPQIGFDERLQLRGFLHQSVSISVGVSGKERIKARCMLDHEITELSLVCCCFDRLHRDFTPDRYG